MALVETIVGPPLVHLQLLTASDVLALEVELVSCLAVALGNENSCLTIGRKQEINYRNKIMRLLTGYLDLWHSLDKMLQEKITLKYVEEDQTLGGKGGGSSSPWSSQRTFIVPLSSPLK